MKLRILGWLHGLLRSKTPFPVSLPPELWSYIAKFLNLKDLSRLYLLNHAFYDAFLCLKYRQLDLLYTDSSRHAKQQIAMLASLRNPEISSKVHVLRTRSRFVDSLISNLPGVQAPPSIQTRAALEQAIHSCLSTLPNLRHLDLHLDSSPNPNAEICSALSATYSKKLVRLTLLLDHARFRVPDHTLGSLLGITFPRLRSLHVTLAVGFKSHPQLLTDLRCLVPEEGGCLEELSIFLPRNQSPLISTSFGSLRKFHLNGEHTAILPFIAPHRNTLQEISLGGFPSKDLLCLRQLNANILTSLSLVAYYLIQYQYEMFPFLSQCTRLRALHLLHPRFCHIGKTSSAGSTPFHITLLHVLPPSLTHLTLPSVILDFKLFLSISQSLPNISSLFLPDCYPADEHIVSHFTFKGFSSSRELSDDLVVALEFKNLHSQLKVLAAQQGLSESNQEVIFKVFLGCLTRSTHCCV